MRRCTRSTDRHFRFKAGPTFGLVVLACSPSPPSVGAELGAVDAAVFPTDSTASIVDLGSADRAALDVVTEGDAPGVPTGRLLLNEVIASPAEGEIDGVELVAVDGDVELWRYLIVDDEVGRAPSPLPGDRLAVGRYLWLEADGETHGEIGLRLPFKLGRDDALTLLRDGFPVDTIDWNAGDAVQGESFGRLPDGTGPWQLLRPTRGLPNASRVALTSPFEGDRVVEVCLSLLEREHASLLSEPEVGASYRAGLVFDGVSLEDVVVEPGLGERPAWVITLDGLVPGQSLEGRRRLQLEPGDDNASCLRGALASEVARAFGLPAPRSGFAEVYVNELSLGLYCLVEPLDPVFFEAHFGRIAGTYYQAELPAGDLVYRGREIDAYDGLSLIGEARSDHHAFLDLVRALNAGDPATYALVMDVELTLRHLALQAVTSSLEGPLGSARGYGLFAPLSWGGTFAFLMPNLSRSLGGFTCGCAPSEVLNFPIDASVCGLLSDRPLFRRLMEVPALKARYRELVSELVAGPFSEGQMEARLERFLTVVSPFIDAGEADLAGLRGFLRDRPDLVRAQLDSPELSTTRPACALLAPIRAAPLCGDASCDVAERGQPGSCRDDCEDAVVEVCGDRLCEARERFERRCDEDCD